MKDRFTDRLCSDCVHCDVVHSWCRKRNAKTAPFVKHPKDRVCDDYYDMFTAGEDGWYRSLSRPSDILPQMGGSDVICTSEGEDRD